MTAITLQSQMTAAEVKARIVEVGEHEKISKAMIAQVALECLAHAVQHGDITLTTDLIQNVTAGNRTAIVLLFKETTAFSYNQREKAFGKKDKADAETLAEKEKSLQTFLTKYQGNIWAWYEKTKEDKIVSAKFNEKALIKQLGAYLAEKGLSAFDDNFQTILARAQGAAVQEHHKVTLINARVSELMETLNLDKDVATMQAEKDYDAGRLTATAANDQPAAEQAAA